MGTRRISRNSSSFDPKEIWHQTTHLAQLARGRDGMDLLKNAKAPVLLKKHVTPLLLSLLTAPTLSRSTTTRHNQVATVNLPRPTCCGQHTAANATGQTDMANLPRDNSTVPLFENNFKMFQFFCHSQFILSLLGHPSLHDSIPLFLRYECNSCPIASWL